MDGKPSLKGEWLGHVNHLNRGGSRNFHLGRPVKGQANFG